MSSIFIRAHLFWIFAAAIERSPLFFFLSFFTNFRSIQASNIQKIHSNSRGDTCAVSNTHIAYSHRLATLSTLVVIIVSCKVPKYRCTSTDHCVGFSFLCCILSIVKEIETRWNEYIIQATCKSRNNGENKEQKRKETWKIGNDCGNFSELHRTTEFMVLDQRQLPAQRLLLVSGLLEPRDLVGHWHYKSGIHHRFADQTLPSELCLAAPLFR